MSLSDAIDVLHQADPDRMAALTLLPVPERVAQIALHALAAELARVPRTSDEPMLAEIRLQWWVDELGRLPDSAGLHPLLAALSEVAAPPPAALAALAEGQRAACAAEPLEDLAETLGWIDATGGALASIAAKASGPAGAALTPEQEAAIRDQGRALAIAGLILRGGARAVAPDLHAPLRAEGLAAARRAAAVALPRALAPILAPPPALDAALAGLPPPSEFARRRALLWFLLRRDWRFRGAR